MSSEVVPYEKKSKKATTCAVDTTNETIVPVDFSFYKVKRIDDLQKEIPNNPTKKILSDDKKELFISTILKLNNNLLEDISSLSEYVTTHFNNPCLQWIDLSFNELRTVDEALLSFEGLKILYLHGNLIESEDEVRKLTPLQSLQNLTLHGNPFVRTGAQNTKSANHTDEKVYKHFVIDNFKNLVKLDFTRITKEDRITACTHMKRKQGKKKKKDMDETD